MKKLSGNTLKNGTLRLAKHSLFSLGGTLTDTLVLWVCSTFLFSGYWGENILSPFISFECANVVNFFLSSKVVFRDRYRNAGTKSQFKKFIVYNITYTSTFFLKMPLLLFIQWGSGWDVVVCNLLALCITGFVNFFMNDKLIFRDKVRETSMEELVQKRVSEDKGNAQNIDSLELINH